MALFDWFKRKKPDAAPEIPSTGLEHPLTTPKLPFPHTLLPKMTDREYMEVWQAADRTQGVPILLRRDSALMDLLAEGTTADGPLPDLDAFLEPNILDLQENDEGAVYRGKPGDTAPAVTAFQSFQFNQTSGVILAYIPVEEPWQVFRRIPIGGWNECPDAETIMAFCKRMYEQYGAVPALISEDTLELVPARRPNAEEAYPLAEMMYAFCPDIICQGPAYSAHALADCLTKSDVWPFWWD